MIRSPISLPPAMAYPAFRAYWIGSIASVSGFQIMRFAQFWLIFQITGSPLALGYVGLANGVPAIILNLFGGVAADRIDQRFLIVVSQIITAILVFLLGTLAILDMVTIWNLLTIAFVAGAVEAFDQPARRALFPQLIDRKDMVSAVALNSAIWPFNRIAGPAIAGFIIALAGNAAPFYVAGAGFLVMAGITAGLKVPRIIRSSSGSPVQDLLEGLKFISKNSIFSFVIAMTFFNGFFGGSYITLMPMFALDVLNVGAGGQGLLMGVGGVGSLCTSLWLATRRNQSGVRLLLIGGGLMTGVSVAAFGITAKYLGSFELAMFFMFATGVFHSMFITSSQSTLQILVPNELRGRIMGFHGMTFNLQPLGGMQAGALASIGAIGAPFAVAFGGVAVAIFALGPGMLNRSLRNLDSMLAESTAAARIDRGHEARLNQPLSTGAGDSSN